EFEPTHGLPYQNAHPYLLAGSCLLESGALDHSTIRAIVLKDVGFCHPPDVCKIQQRRREHSS
uniref:Uncharacterized protein n=1 Tax=Parascaris univalens TaxID=6257 RepID=A0A915BTR4_PARUN